MSASKEGVKTRGSSSPAGSSLGEGNRADADGFQADDGGSGGAVKARERWVGRAKTLCDK